MPDAPLVVHGVAGLHLPDDRIAVSVGVFDGLHRGHVHLLGALASQAAEWGARPAVVTFDAHPDEVLRGEAPPLLLDPAERLERIGAAGIGVLVVEHFDDRLRMTAYDEFVRGIASHAGLAGFVMTPESAFGHERRGTPEALAALGREMAYEVAVVPPLLVEGRPISSSAIRKLVSAGDLAGAADLLGRPYAVVGTVDEGGRMSFPLPVALPPDGEYEATIEDRSTPVAIAGGGVRLATTGHRRGARIRVVFGRPAASALPDPGSAGTIRRS